MKYLLDVVFSIWTKHGSSNVCPVVSVFDEKKNNTNVPPRVVRIPSVFYIKGKRVFSIYKLVGARYA